MSHEISNIDKQQGRSMGWHKKTEVRDDLTAEKNWLNDWDVTKSPLFSADGRKTEFCELVCTDDPKIRVGVPVHCEKYGVISNKAFLGVIDDILLTVKGAKIDSIGSICERSRIFASISLPEMPEFKAAGRVHKAFLQLLSSHDKSCELSLFANSFAVVCANTFNASLSDRKGSPIRASVRHSKNAANKLENLAGIVDAYCGTQARFAQIMDNLADQTVTQSKAERFFAGFLTVKDDSAASKFLRDKPEVETSTRRTNQIDRLSTLFVSGAGNRGNDRADIFNAVTDYYSHESSGGENVFRQVASSEFGAGQTAKSRAFSVLQDSASFEQLVNVGDLVLASN